MKVNPFASPEHRYGTSLESLLERRERVAKSEGANYGAGKMFSELTERVLRALPAEGGSILEVDAGAGLLTRMLLAAGHEVTALEPAPLLCKLLEEIDNDGLEVCPGFVGNLSTNSENNAPGEQDAAFLFDSAIVSFPARRGRGILALIVELLPLVKDQIMLILPDDGSVDWTSTLRTISLKGYRATAEFVVDLEALESAQRTRKLELGQMDVRQIKRAMLMTVHAKPQIERALSPSQVISAWGASIRCIEVPYPVPRGAATRLVRYFTAGGDRSILIKTEAAGMHHLYGNLRTAAHRLARDQIAVRRVDEGIQLMQIIQSEIRPS
ncbi:MAG: hypothetical protein FWC86_03165 [Coriobacteriia bacterium]|nr:hypothetical protein [Coriobacteriia bacterium]